MTNKGRAKARPFFRLSMSPTGSPCIRDVGLDIRGYRLGRCRPPADKAVQAANFSPMMPQTINAMQPSLMAVAGSPSSQMPSSAVPTVPIPVHTA